MIDAALESDLAQMSPNQNRDYIAQLTALAKKYKADWGMRFHSDSSEWAVHFKFPKKEGEKEPIKCYFTHRALSAALQFTINEVNKKWNLK